jgi:hypothetical protein
MQICHIGTEIHYFESYQGPDSLAHGLRFHSVVASSYQNGTLAEWGRKKTTFGIA